MWVAFAAAVLGVASVAFGVRALGGGAKAEKPLARVTMLSQETSVTTESSLASSAVEVPDVVGQSLDEARLVLEAAGLGVRVITDGATSTPSPEITSQDPSSGTVASAGAVVAVTVPARVSAAPKKKDKAPKETWVVCVDPGHQEDSDSSPEPIGPGAKQTKPAVTGGTTGASTGIPEYEIALQISMNLKQRLEDRGVKVVMTRTTNDVALSNSERAAVANKQKADLFVRVHGDGNPDSKMAGISTLYPGPNRWTGDTTAPSKRAAQLVQRSVVAATGAVDRGIKPRTDISGFNYAEMPSVLIETGFMSNPVEDKLLASPHYQDKLAIGMADGIVAYLRQNGK